MKKFLYGFIIGYLLFCGLSAWALPPGVPSEWSDLNVNGEHYVFFADHLDIVPFWGTGPYGLCNAYTWSGGDKDFYLATFENSGTPIYWSYQVVGGSIENSGDWISDFSGGDASTLPSGVSVWSESSNTTNGTNIVVSANTNDSTWATVISAGVNGSTNITQISITLNDLLRDSSEFSAMKTSGGNSVFKNTSSGVSYFDEMMSKFYDKVNFSPETGSLFVRDDRQSFDGSGRALVGVDWDNMPAYPELSLDGINATLDWSGAPSWFADGSVNVDLSAVQLELEGIHQHVDYSQVALEAIHSQQDSDSSWWREAWANFATTWDNFTTGFFEKWDETFISGGSSVFKDGAGQSAFVDADGKSYLASLVEGFDSEWDESQTDPGTNTFDELPDLVETNYDDAIEADARDKYDQEIEYARQGLSNDMLQAFASISNQTAKSVEYIRGMTNGISAVSESLTVSPGYITDTLVVVLPQNMPNLGLPASIELKWHQSWLGPASVLGYGLSLLAIVFGIMMGSKILAEV